MFFATRNGTGQEDAADGVRVPAAARQDCDQSRRRRRVGRRPAHRWQPRRHAVRLERQDWCASRTRSALRARCQRVRGIRLAEGVDVVSLLVVETRGGTAATRTNRAKRLDGETLANESAPSSEICVLTRHRVDATGKRNAL